MPKRYWDLTPGDTNPMEGSHAQDNQVSRTNHGLIDAILSARQYDANTANVLKMSLESGVLENEVWSIAFSPNGAHIVFGSADQTVRIWDVMTGAVVTEMEGHSEGVSSVAFSADGAHIVSGSDDQTVRIWDATTGVELSKMEGHSGEVWSVAFSPNGARVVSSSDDRTVRIWDATTGAEVLKMEGHSDGAIECTRYGRY
ncbi:WD40-repeat-containing domain protein [Mycena olivaceomarginata]|nr:WD40-repeat-containing domain protein [Mycena olivaceomarginata]